MNKEDNKKLRAYYKSIKNQLACTFFEKRKILNSIKKSVSDYLFNNPSADFDDIENKLGDAETVSASVNCYDILKSTRQKSRAMKIAIIIGSVIAAIAVVCLVFVLIEAIKNNTIIVK